MSENALSRAIMLGLALLSGGAHAAAPPPAAAPEPFDPADLTGLVALDGEPAGESGPGEVQEGDPAGNCPGPSGCVADLILSTLSMGGSDRLDGVTIPGVALVQNNPLSGLDAYDVEVTVQAGPNQRITAAGCQQPAPSTVVCPIGRLQIGARAALPFVAESLGPNSFQWQLVASVSSPQPDPTAGNNTLVASPELASSLQRFARLAQFNPSSCPVIEADVSVTDRNGVPADGPVPGQGWLDVFDDGQWAGSPLASDPNTQPSSVVFLLDNSGIVEPPRLQAHKLLVTQAAAAWRQDAVAAGWPLPAFAVASTAAPGSVGEFSADPAVLAAQLGAVQPSSGISRLYDALIGSASTLAARPGRFAVVAFVEAGDGTGSALADPLRPLQSVGVPVYPIVGRADLEPLARRIAKASSGFRQVSFADGQQALSRAIGAVRRQSRLSWIAPSGGEPRREATIRQTNLGVGLDAAGWYSQQESACARPCVATRSLPSIGSPGSNPSVVRLAIDPGNGPLSFSLRETVPTGVNVSAVSDGGVYNSGDRSIRWNGKLISAPTEFTYSVSGTGSLLSFAVDAVFKGALSAGAELRPTCGDTASPLWGRHPADIEVNGRILPSVAQAYAESWRRGWPWIDGISPIPVAHMTRAGQIQAFGGAYQRVDAPVPWVRFAPPLLPYVLSAQRSAPAVYVPGGDVAVVLQVQPHAQGVFGAVEEHVPGGWEVVSIGQAGVFDPANNVMRWGPFQDNQPRTLEYTLRAPAGATQAVSLVGRYSVDGDQQEFSGRTSLGNAQLDPLFADDFE